MHVTPLEWPLAHCSSTKIEALAAPAIDLGAVDAVSASALDAVAADAGDGGHRARRRDMRRCSTSLAVAMLLAVTAGVSASCKSEGNAGANAPDAGTVGPTCGASLDAQASGAAWVAAPEAVRAVSQTFTATIDPKNPTLGSEWVQPHSEAITLRGGVDGLRLWGGVKPFARHPGRLMVELFVINDGKSGLRDAKVTLSGVTGSATFYDLNVEPLASASAPAPMSLGGIAPEGVSGHLRFGFDVDGAKGPISFTLTLEGSATTRTSTTSSPIAVTPDGKEVWATFADADVVSVIDTATDTRMANVPLGSRPSSAAITPDGKLVLVASAGCNQLTVIDRATRTPVQVFGEREGIGREPRNVVVSPDGAKAYVSAYVGDNVTVLERAGDRFRVVGNVPVGRRPTGMSVTPDGGTLMVAHFMPRGRLDANEGWISLVATDSMTLAGETRLEDDGNTAPSACIASITGFDKFTASDLRTEAVPEQLAGIFLDPSGVTGWVPATRPGAIPIFEGDVTRVGFTFSRVGANSPSDLFPIDTRDPRKAKPMRLPSLVDITDREESYLLCRPGFEDVEGVSQFPVSGRPNVIQSPGTATPSGSTPLSELGVSRFVGFTRGGRRAMLLSYNSDEIMLVDAATHHPTSVHYFLLSGSNPIGIAVTPDGKKGYVAYENSTYASVLDLSAYAGDRLPEPSTVPYQMLPGQPGQVAGIDTFAALHRDASNVPDLPSIKETGKILLVDSDPMPAATRRGKILFTSSNPMKYPTLSGIREASCSSCHPNGGNDGTVWGTMEGERRTLGLWGGTAGRGWLHASGTHQDVTAFATSIVKERLGGTGLSPDDERALEEYVARGIPKVQAPAVDAALAAAGKAYFETHCVSCHQGELRTSGAPDSANPFGGGKAEGPILYDVGSATNWAGATLGVPFTNLFPPPTRKLLSDLRGDRALGEGDSVQQALLFSQRPNRARGAFKAPPLVNEWENNLFFHDGRAASLEDAVRDIAPRVGPQPSDEEVKALVEYLKTL